MNKILKLITIGVFGAYGCTNSIKVDQQIIALAQYERRPAETIASDMNIERNCYEELQDKDQIQNQAKVKISVFNSAILIVGTASNESVKNEIITSIQVIDHVKLVHDHISVGPSIPENIITNDNLTTENINFALTQIQSIPGFNSKMIKVTTSNSIVYLMGQIHRNEGIVAINVVRHLPNIKQIVALFEYLD